MGRFVVRRVLSMILVLFAISVITFLIFQVIPGGDPAVRLAGKQPQPDQLERIREQYGFNDPVPVQYLNTMKQIFTGKITSYTTQINVVDEIKQDFPRTFWLALGAGLLWLSVSIVFGLFTAVKAGKFGDRLLTVFALVGISMPVFWIGALVNYYLGYKAGIFPNGGYTPFFDSPPQWIYHLLMPWTVLSLLFVGIYSRLLRSNVLDTINEDYVRTARAKGLSERQVLVRHVLRNSLIPIITLWGLDFGAVLGGGAILTEVVFDLQGVGQYAFESVGQLDVPPVLTITMFGAFFIVVLNTVVDILYAFLDPRIRVA